MIGGGLLTSFVAILCPTASVVDTAELDQESSDVRENIRRKFLVEMPEDFYQFWEFCKSINLSTPESKWITLLNLCGQLNTVCTPMCTFAGVIWPTELASWNQTILKITVWEAESILDIVLARGFTEGAVPFELQSSAIKRSLCALLVKMLQNRPQSLEG